MMAKTLIWQKSCRAGNQIFSGTEICWVKKRAISQTDFVFLDVFSLVCCKSSKKKEQFQTRKQVQGLEMCPRLLSAKQQS